MSYISGTADSLASRLHSLSTDTSSVDSFVAEGAGYTTQDSHLVDKWDKEARAAKFRLTNNPVNLYTKRLGVPELRLRYQSTTIGSGDPYGNDRCLYHNGYLYMTNGINSLYVFDVTDLSAPSLLKTLTINSLASLVGSGNYVYATAMNGIVYTVSVSTPSNASIVGTFDTGFGAELFGWPWPVINGNYLYCSFNSPDNSGIAGSIIIYNITNPLSLSITKRIRFPEVSQGGGGISISGNYLYAGDYFSKSYRADELNVFHVIDVTTPASASIVATFSVESSTRASYNGWAYFARGNRLYIADYEVIQVWDITSPLASTKAYEYNGTYLHDVEGIILAPTINYIFAGSSFDLKAQVIDITSDTLNVVQQIDSKTAMGRGLGISETNRALFCVLNGYFAIYSY